MIKNTRFTKIRQITNTLAVKAKGKLTHNVNGQKMRCNAKKDIAYLIASQRKRGTAGIL